MIYAIKKFGAKLSAEEVRQVKSTLGGIEKIPFTPKPGQSAADLAAEKRKIVNVIKEISTIL